MGKVINESGSIDPLIVQMGDQTTGIFHAGLDEVAIGMAVPQDPGHRRLEHLPGLDVNVEVGNLHEISQV